MMKNLKLVLPLFAIILGLGIVFTQSAFKTKVAQLAKTSTYWRFDGTNINDARNFTKYVKITDPEAPSCEEGNDLPCVLALASSINTPSLLEAHLENTSIYPNDQAVVDASMYKKEAPAQH